MAITDLDGLSLGGLLRAASIGAIHKMLLTYDDDDNVVYIGLAKAGTAEDEEEWQIKRMSYDGDDNLIAVEFASGVISFTHVWDDRTTYAYS